MTCVPINHVPVAWESIQQLWYEDCDSLLYKALPFLRVPSRIVKTELELVLRTNLCASVLYDRRLLLTHSSCQPNLNVYSVLWYGISIQIWSAIYRKCHLVFNHSIANVYIKRGQPKLILIGQIVELVGKWPMANCYFVFCESK